VEKKMRRGKKTKKRKKEAKPRALAVGEGDLRKQPPHSHGNQQKKPMMNLQCRTRTRRQ
jgi:hypothetical protein